MSDTSMKGFSKASRIGILGGSFNPVHRDHLTLAKTVKDTLELDKVLFIPNASPAYKNTVSVSYADRRRMLEITLKNYGELSFEILDLEEDSSVHHYTWDSLQKLRQIYGKDAGLFFIMGLDSLLYLDEWKHGLKLHTLANLVCMKRGGYEFTAMKSVIADYVGRFGIYDDAQERFQTAARDPAGHLLIMKSELHQLSSSALRKALATEGLESVLVRDFMDPQAAGYALKHHLYS